MAKVTFEFDEYEEREDVNVIINRHKLLNAINKIDDLRRQIYKGYLNEGDSIYLKKDGCKATQEDYDLASLKGEYLEGGETYLRADYVENKLNEILEGVIEFI